MASAYAGPLKTKIQISYRAGAIIDPSMYATFQREMVGFLNNRMESPKAFDIIRTTVRTQAIFPNDELRVQMEVQASVIIANGSPTRDLGDEVLATLMENSVALERKFLQVSLGFELGEILSVVIPDRTASPFYSNDIATRSPNFTPAPVVFPTLPPFNMPPIMTNTPSVLPTLSPVTQAPIVTTTSPTFLPTLVPFANDATTTPSAPVRAAPTPSPIKIPEDTFAPSPAPTVKARTPIPSGKAPQEQSIDSPTPSVSPSKDPTGFTPTQSLTPTIETTDALEAFQKGLFTKNYQTEMTVKLFGLSNTIPEADIVTVERVTREFIQETIPAVRSVIMEIPDVHLLDQSLIRVSNSLLQRPVGLRRRSLVEHGNNSTDNTSLVLLLTLIVDGEGWSTDKQVLETIHFDDLARYGLVTRYDDYIARLWLSSDTFQYLSPVPDNDEPPVSAPAGTTSDTSRRNKTVVLPVLAVSLGTALLAGAVCAVMVFGRRKADSDSTDVTGSNSNDVHDEESIDVQYTEDQRDEYLFDENIPRIISPGTRKKKMYPIQEQRGNFTPLSDAFECCSSLQSPSMGSIDVDNWSLVSGSMNSFSNRNQAITKNSSTHKEEIEVSFSMEALDEFEANLSMSPEMMARRRLFDEDYVDNP